MSSEHQTGSTRVELSRFWKGYRVMSIVRFIRWMLLATASALAAGIASGQEYPSKTIRIVTAAVGGGGDRDSRLIAQGISGPLGQPVIVDNRAGGTVAAEVVSKAAP